MAGDGESLALADTSISCQVRPMQSDSLVPKAWFGTILLSVVASLDTLF